MTYLDDLLKETRFWYLHLRWLQAVKITYKVHFSRQVFLTDLEKLGSNEGKAVM